ncbi:MAG: hypothetical protein KKG33_05660 [candidate division Zixibacteria bacterium]|nr:hypothetical protein [candidate division Zixibacteria bacterium]
MTGAGLGIVGVICLAWSLLAALVLHLTNVKLFDEPGLFWFSVVFTPVFLVAWFNWTHRIRYLWYVVMLYWFVQLVQGNQVFVLFAVIGYPTALIYEIMFRRFLRVSTATGEETGSDINQEKTKGPPEHGMK